MAYPDSYPSSYPSAGPTSGSPGQSLLMPAAFPLEVAQQVDTDYRQARPGRSFVQDLTASLHEQFGISSTATAVMGSSLTGSAVRHWVVTGVADPHRTAVIRQQLQARLAKRRIPQRAVSHWENGRASWTQVLQQAKKGSVSVPVRAMSKTVYSRLLSPAGANAVEVLIHHSLGAYHMISQGANYPIRPEDAMSLALILLHEQAHLAMMSEGRIVAWLNGIRTALDLPVRATGGTRHSNLLHYPRANVKSPGIYLWQK